MDYICHLCGAEFDTDTAYHHECDEDEGGGYLRMCPNCGGDEFDEAEECICGRLRFSDELLCEVCRKTLYKNFLSFVEDLNTTELEQLEEWITDKGIDNIEYWDDEK